MKNKSTDIYFFTGTGNTYLAAKKIAQTLEQNGCAVRLFDMAKSDPEKADLAKTIGVFFPIACWNTYPFVRRFINKLPKAQGTEAFVCSTMGDSSLKAAATIGDMLKNKGYSLIATKGFAMPNNLIAVQSEEKNIIKKDKAYAKMERFAADIANNAAKPEQTNVFLKFCFAVTAFITNLWESKLSQKLMRFNIIKEKCVKCGLCVKICPVKNISMKEYPVFDGGACQFCVRCISYCPQKAISKFLIFSSAQAIEISF